MPTSVNLEEIRQRISVINAQSAQINNTRSVNLGRKQTLESQLKTLLNTYSSKYGVQLTPETLNDEIMRVSADKEEECRKLSEVLEAINSQDYARANQLLNIQVEEPAKDTAQTVASQPTVGSQDALHMSSEVIQSAMDITGAVVEDAVTAPKMPETNVSAPVVEPPKVEAPQMTTESVQPPVQPAPSETVAPPVFNGGVGAPPNLGVPSGAVPPTMANNFSASFQSQVVAPPVQPTNGVVTPPPVVNNGISGSEFMQNVNEDNKVPMAALAGFTKGVGSLQGLDAPNLDVAPPNPQQPKNFGDILGNNNFGNN